MKKIKKILKIFLIILVLLILALIVYQIYIRYDGKIDKSNQMSRSEVVELLKNGEEYPNYVITYAPSKSALTDEMMVYEKLPQKMYIKDNIIKFFIGNKEWSYKNFDTKECIYMFDSLQANISNVLEGDKIVSCRENVETEEYEYIGEKEINNRKTIIIKLTDDEYKNNDYTKLYIDKQTGVLYNVISYNHIIGPIYTIHDQRMSVEFDCVTDEDVKRPNLAGYVIYDSREENN